MMKRIMVSIVVLIAAAAVCQAAPKYKLVKLPIAAEDINNKGHIVGEKGVNEGWCRAAIWVSGKTKYLETDAQHEKVSLSVATAINDKDQVIGYRQVTGALTSNSSLYWENGKFSELEGVRKGHRGGNPVGINNKGQIVGAVDNGNVEEPGGIALLWANSKAAARDIGWGSSSAAEAINDLGDIVLGVDHVDGYHLYLLSKGKTIEIMDRRPGYEVSMNNRGQVVGWFEGSGDHSSFVWQKGKLITVKSPYKDMPSIELTDINNRGQAIGYVSDRFGKYQAVIWENGKITDLSKQVRQIGSFKLKDPKAINDKGWIVGDGWLLVPVGK